MTRKTIRITRVNDGFAACFEIGPHEPFHRETMPFDALPEHLREAGMAAAEIEITLATVAEQGSAVKSFFPGRLAGAAREDHARRSESRKARRRLVARMKTAEKTFQAAATEFKAVMAEHGELKSFDSAVAVLRAAKREVAALDRYTRLIEECIKVRRC